MCVYIYKYCIMSNVCILVSYNKYTYLVKFFNEKKQEFLSNGLELSLIKLIAYELVWTNESDVIESCS